MQVPGGENAGGGFLPGRGARVHDPSRVTLVLHELRAGNAAAKNELVQLVYHELRKLAGAQLRRERSNHTLQATALVHETYLRLMTRDRVDYQDRAHFFGAAAHVMRNILVDHARTVGARKRGGGLAPVELTELFPAVEQRADEILAVDAALTKLEKLSSRQRTIVEMRFYAGFTEEEIAEMLHISVRTVKREWATAKAWLTSEMRCSRTSASGK